jgi:hypothetical protein
MRAHTGVQAMAVGWNSGGVTMATTRLRRRATVTAQRKESGDQAKAGSDEDQGGQDGSSSRLMASGNKRACECVCTGMCVCAGHACVHMLGQKEQGFGSTSARPRLVLDQSKDGG